MKRTKLLFESILVYGFGGIIGNIIPFIMLPVITRLIPDTSFMGYSDIVTTIVAFASAVMTMGLYDASFRIIFDYDEINEKKSVFNSALGTVLLISMFLITVLLASTIPASKMMFGKNGFRTLWIIGIFTAFFKALNNVHNVPLRSQNRKKVYLVINIVVPILPYLISVPMIMYGQYLYALPVAALVSVIIQSIMYWFINKNWIEVKTFSKEKSKALLKVGAPLMPCFLVYWIFNSCDKLMILHYIGAQANGIYAVGGKIGQLSQLIYQAFSSGWQFFAYTTMKDKDQVGMISKIMEYLNVISCAAGVIMMVFSNLIFDILFTGDYRKGTIIAPYLFLSPLVLMLYQTVASQFMIMNKSWLCIIVLAVGAIINVFCNYFFIPVIGIEGAAIATLIGYVVTLSVTLFILVRWKQLRIGKRVWIVWGVLLLTGVFWRFICYNDTWIKLVLGIISIGVYVIIYIKELRIIINKLKNLREAKES